MELSNSLRRGYLLFQNRTIYSFYHHKSHGKVKDKELLNLRCLVHVTLLILITWIVKHCLSSLGRAYKHTQLPVDLPINKSKLPMKIAEFSTNY